MAANKPEKKCDHLYLALDSIFRQKIKRNQTVFQRTDIFFCQRCLVQTEVKKEDLKSDADVMPDWFDARRSYVITDMR